MDSFLKMDIFFFVSTLAVLVLGVLGGVALFYLVRILRDTADMVHLVHEEAHAIMDDIRLVRVRMTRGVTDLHDSLQRIAVLVEHYAHALSGITVKKFFISLITDLVSRQEKKHTKKKTKKAPDVHAEGEV
jgi:hypothetical protein